jgi:hypothetical protein
LLSDRTLEHNPHSFNSVLTCPSILFEDLEEYAATTGAMLASMQGQLKRWNNTGGDSGNKHGGQY